MHASAIPRFSRALQAWGSDDFADLLKQAVATLETGVLPLDRGGALGGYVDDSDMTVTVIAVTDDPDSVHARIGVFFQELLAGCSCGDEPSPINGYCELDVTIDRITAEVTFSLIPD
ncbi:MAG: glucosamine--fructose-6-phosphate aminotransferase [Thiogranum sp.]|nr:glucosamine--fructose-6-phosphate aminotransferase [Thiogranum sp.]